MKVLEHILDGNHSRTIIYSTFTIGGIADSIGKNGLEGLALTSLIVSGFEVGYQITKYFVEKDPSLQDFFIDYYEPINF